MGWNTPKPSGSAADPPGGWYYDKPLPYVLTPDGEAALDDEAEAGTR
jgi:hypothetical protein